MEVARVAFPMPRQAHEVNDAYEAFKHRFRGQASKDANIGLASIIEGRRNSQGTLATVTVHIAELIISGDYEHKVKLKQSLALAEIAARGAGDIHRGVSTSSPP